MQIEHFINQIDLTLDPPSEEPLRQYYFIAKARMLVAQMEKETGRKMSVLRQYIRMSDELEMRDVPNPHK